MKTLALSASVAVIALTMGTHATLADTTVHTETYVQTQDRENVNEVNFTAFDLNRDGMYAKSEVGKKLFYLFDLDGNEVIDNIEWDDETVYTIMPMEKETFKFVDYGNDGYTDKSTYTYETFYQASGLIRFDDNQNGLSPSEFIGENYKKLDIDDSGMIEIDEWQEAYNHSIRPENAKQEHYNN